MWPFRKAGFDATFVALADNQKIDFHDTELITFKEGIIFDPGDYRSRRTIFEKAQFRSERAAAKAAVKKLTIGNE